MGKDEFEIGNYFRDRGLVPRHSNLGLWCEDWTLGLMIQNGVGDLWMSIGVWVFGWEMVDWGVGSGCEFWDTG